MGAQTSKVARKLPTKAHPETLKNAPKESPSTISSAGIASEIKTEFIEEDNRNLNLHENLKALGPVKIQPTITKMRKSDTTMLGIIHQRHEAEGKELRGHAVSDGIMSTDSLFTLLEQRKHLEPGKQDQPSVRQAILEKYEIDEPTLATLLKNYNTLTIMPPAIDDVEERRSAVWIKDKVDWERQVRNVDKRNQDIQKAREVARKDNIRAKSNEEKKEDKALKDLFDEGY